MALDADRLNSVLEPLPPCEGKKALFLCSGLSFNVLTLPEEGNSPLELTPLTALTHSYLILVIDDGIDGMKFIENVIKSSKNNSKWIQFSSN